MRVAITGAGGQVGGNLARRFAAGMRGHEVVAVCRNFLAARLLAASGCGVRIGSLSDGADARRLLEGCEAVIHCAQDWESLARRESPNVAMIRCISQAAAVRIFIYISSISVYGVCIEPEADAYANPRPDDSYGKDKLMCERQAMGEFSSAGRGAIVVRLGHVYGPHLEWSRRILELARDPRFRLPFGGRQPSNAVRIDRVCDALAGLLSDPPESAIHNLIDDPQRTWSDVFAWHTEACGLESVAPLGDDESQRIRERFLKERRARLGGLGGEMAAAMRAAAAQFANSSPSLVALGSALVARAPQSVQAAVRRRHRRTLMARQLDGAAAGDSGPWLPPLFSAAAPGQPLRAPAAASLDSAGEDRLRSELSRWHARWSSPDGMWRN